MCRYIRCQDRDRFVRNLDWGRRQKASLGLGATPRCSGQILVCFIAYIFLCGWVGNPAFDECDFFRPAAWILNCLVASHMAEPRWLLPLWVLLLTPVIWAYTTVHIYYEKGRWVLHVLSEMFFSRHFRWSQRNTRWQCSVIKKHLFKNKKQCASNRIMARVVCSSLLTYTSATPV